MYEDNLNFDLSFLQNKSVKSTKFDSLKMLRVNLAQLM